MFANSSGHTHAARMCSKILLSPRQLLKQHLTPWFSLHHDVAHTRTTPNFTRRRRKRHKRVHTHFVDSLRFPLLAYVSIPFSVSAFSQVCARKRDSCVVKTLSASSPSGRFQRASRRNAFSMATLHAQKSFRFCTTIWRLHFFHARNRLLVVSSANTGADSYARDAVINFAFVPPRSTSFVRRILSVPMDTTLGFKPSFDVQQPTDFEKKKKNGHHPLSLSEHNVDNKTVKAPAKRHRFTFATAFQQ